MLLRLHDTLRRVSGQAFGDELVARFGLAAIALPRILTHNTERYGLIGFAFSMVSCLFVLAGILIAAAALGSLIDEPSRELDDARDAPRRAERVAESISTPSPS
jgi:hypothetical protein